MSVSVYLALSLAPIPDMGDGGIDREVPVLAVPDLHKQRDNQHSSFLPGVITQPDAEVLDDERLLLPDLQHRDDFSPVVFLNFLSCLRKYQKRDLATIWSVAKILIL